MQRLTKNYSFLCEYFVTSFLAISENNFLIGLKNGKLIKSGSMKEIKGDKSLENVFMELEENK